MSHTFGRRTQGELRRTETDQLRGILLRSGGYWFDADTYNGTGSVSALRCKVTGALQTFAVAATLPVASPAFGGARVIAITTEVCDSNLAASSWGFLHKSAGANFVHVAAIGAGLAADGVMHATLDVLNTSTQAGSWCEFVGSNQLTTSITSNGTTSPANGRIMQTTTTAFAADGVASYLDVSLASSDTPDFTARIKGTSSSTGNFSGVPSSGDPAQTLRMFRNYGGTAMQFVGLWAMSIYKPVPFTADERAVLQRYVRAKYRRAP